MNTPNRYRKDSAVPTSTQPTVEFSELPPMQKVRAGFDAAVAGVLMTLMFGMIPAALFVCIDDWLAEITGLPLIGELGFWRAFALYSVWRFVASVFGPLQVFPKLRVKD